MSKPKLTAQELRAEAKWLIKVAKRSPKDSSTFISQIGRHHIPNLQALLRLVDDVERLKGEITQTLNAKMSMVNEGNALWEICRELRDYTYGGEGK